MEDKRMLQMNDSNLNFNAVSHDGHGEQFATLNASYNGGTNVYFSVNLEKMASANITAIKNDFDTFVDTVVASITRANQPQS